MQQQASSSSQSTPSKRPSGWKRRIAKACDSCRRKRIKCSGARPVCSQCSSTDASCHYADAVNKQTRPRPQRVSHVQQLQDRVNELEATVRSLSPANVVTGRGSSHDSAGRGTMVVEDTGELRYFGPSSSISILSPHGLQWLESRTADASLRQRLELPLKGGGSWTKWTHPRLQSICPTTTSTPLPPWHDALALVNDFFENYNTALPVFHPPTFMGLLGRQYARDSNSIDDPAWVAALNAVLALAQRSKAELQPHARELADRAWAYANNALEVVLAVLMRSVSLLSVQAILALAWFFRGTPNPQPFFFLTAAALRLAHSVGLHRGAEHLPLDLSEREQRLRVFWIALIFDFGASFRTGRPCAHSINDIGTAMPAESPKDNLGIIVNRRSSAVFNFLTAKAKFSLLEGRVYDSIFAAHASEKSIEALSKNVHDIGQELDEWARAVPGATDCSELSDEWSNQQPHILGMLLAYHSCIITVHSATWQRDFSSLRARRTAHHVHDHSPVGFPHMEKCLHSAHEIIRLLSLVPRESTSFIWESIQCPVQTLLLFFIHLLQQPDDTNADIHLRAMDDATGFISILVKDQEDTFAQPILALCHELTRIARAAGQKGRSRTDKALPDHAQDTTPAPRSTNQHPLPPQMNSSTGFRNIAPAIPLLVHDGSGVSSGAEISESTRQARGSAHISNEQFPAEVTYQEQFDFEQGISGIDQLSDLPLPFPWNWQDLSTGLLEDFNFL